MAKVVVTRKIPGSGIKMLQEAGFEVAVSPQDRVLARNELLNFIQGADGVLTQLNDKVDESFISAAGANLKVVANFAVGFDNLDLPALLSHNIVATNTPDVLTEAVAEHTIALIFAISRRIVEADKLARSQTLEFGPSVLLGMELNGKTLGILGLGRIGSRVAEIGKAVGMEVAYYDVKKNSEFESKVGAIFKITPEELLAVSDIVSIHVPLLNSTKHLINAERLKMMKPTSYLINTSRGPVVDEVALTQSLKSGVIKGAALDVFENEPRLSPGLENLANVVLTPHIASATTEARSAMGELAAKNIIAVLSGQSPLTPIKKP
ncbi:MAG: D-glycerate dehydrogenase [Candidatus Daviesbacteria bacterium]|nr:MAG: D-glycerate dehydrogenase [Candidatus Daviesbacteria bacterium]